MKYLKILTIIPSSLIILTSVGYAQDNIYTWRSANGNVVFSQIAPIFEKEFKEVGVRRTSQIHSESSPILSQLDTIKKNDLYIKQEESKPKDNKTHQRKTLNVRIISPTNNDRIFAHGLKLAITLEPRLTADDSPVFLVNDIPTRGHYQNGLWMIYRPNPGPVDITVRGSTHDHKIINSTGNTQITLKSVFGR
jgi:hypothetical protein